jgi:hypothetical protein
MVVRGYKKDRRFLAVARRASDDVAVCFAAHQPRGDRVRYVCLPVPQFLAHLSFPVANKYKEH